MATETHGLTEEELKLIMSGESLPGQEIEPEDLVF
jgi:hypothetical protein